MTQLADVHAEARPRVLRADFPPIVDTARGAVAGYEALARFPGSQHIRPDHWFAAAHAAGCGAELEAQALRTALDARPALPPTASCR
jgi:EAL domain-containing protein (putative c-di-GMP-specific phosphodiesterase class I)